MNTRARLAQLALFASCLGSGSTLPHNKREEDFDKFKKLKMKGLSSKEMGTAGTKKLSRAKRKSMKNRRK